MIKSARASDQLTIYLSGEIDHHAALTIRDDIEKLLSDPSIKRLLFDFSKVSFMDSSGIALILRAQRRMQTLGGSLLVCRVPQQARRVLDAAGIDRVVTIR